MASFAVPYDWSFTTHEVEGHRPRFRTFYTPSSTLSCFLSPLICFLFYDRYATHDGRLFTHIDSGLISAICDSDIFCIFFLTLLHLTFHFVHVRLGYLDFVTLDSSFRACMTRISSRFCCIRLFISCMYDSDD